MWHGHARRTPRSGVLHVCILHSCESGIWGGGAVARVRPQQIGCTLPLAAACTSAVWMHVSLLAGRRCTTLFYSRVPAAVSSVVVGRPVHASVAIGAAQRHQRAMLSSAAGAGASMERPAKRMRPGQAAAESFEVIIQHTQVVSVPPAAGAGDNTSSSSAAAAPLIGTHSGSFHCDEALACAMLKTLPRFADSTIVRTRDPVALAACDIIVDVGAEYDAGAGKLDHHQKSFVDTYSAARTMTKLSSAGLVYKHYGREVVAALAAAASGQALAPAALDVIVSRVYDNFIQEIDAVDNGVEVAEGALRYRIRTGLSSRVARLNPAWNEPSSDVDANAGFRQAMLLTLADLAAVVSGLVRHWLPARALVETALADAEKVSAGTTSW
jgi:uncharacterized UPF0160 family protein